MNTQSRTRKSASAPPRAPRPASTPGPRPLLLAAAVFLVALAWRLAYLARLDASVLGRSVVADAEIYWEWSRVLLAEGWWGRSSFFMGPLYPYSVAVIRAAGGDSIPAVLAVQATFGAAACALLGDAARRASGSAWIGLACGLAAAFYEMGVFMDGLILMESQLLFLEALLVWTMVARPPSERGARALLGIGVLVGLLAAGRATAALLVPVVIAFVVAPGAAGGPGGRGRARAALAVVAGFLLVAAPIAVRNYTIGREWIPFTYNGGLNLYIGNNPAADGTFALVTGTHSVSSRGQSEGVGIDGREYVRLTTGRALTPAQSSAYWSERAIAFMREEPARALGLALRRLAMLWNVVEYGQVENADEFRQVAGPLGLPGIGTWAVLGPLALLGAGLVALRRRGGWAGRFALAYALTVTVAVLPFFVTDRYRLHLVPAAFVLAAIALAEVVAAMRAGRARSLAPLAAGLVLGVAIVNLPVPRISEAKRAWGIASDLGARYVERGRAAEAIVEFERALAIERAGGLRAERGDPTRSLERASVYNNYALALDRVGRTDEARTWFGRALELAPDNAEILQGLAASNARRGAVAVADSLYARMGGVVRGAGGAELGRGMLAAREGRLADAAAHFREAARLEPRNGAAWGALIRIELQSGDAAGADSALALAAQAGWDDDAARLHHALVLAVRGDREGARAVRARVDGAVISADATLLDVDRMLMQVLERGTPRPGEPNAHTGR